MHFFKDNLKYIGILDCTEVRFTSFLYGGFITAIVVNLPENAPLWTVLTKTILLISVTS